MDEEIEFKFIGWVYETDADGTKHDKVWTAFKVGDSYYAAWGKRNKALGFKNYGTSWRGEREQAKVMAQKQRKYDEVDEFKLFALFPDFKEAMQTKLLFATLAGKVR